MVEANMKPNKVTIHCSATRNGEHVNIEAIRKDHIENRHFSDIGYHAIIQPSGDLDLGRPLNVVGAHVEDHNQQNVGICLIGTDRFTMAQFERLKAFLEALRLGFNINAQDIFCHYEWDSAKKQGKTCPNFRLGNFLVWYLTGKKEAIESYIFK